MPRLQPLFYIPSCRVSALLACFAGVTSGHPTPRQIFRAFDQGKISREEFRKAMRLHAEHLIAEMEDVHQNPIAAWMEMLKNRRLAWRLARTHGEVLIREIFVALSEIPDFPLASWLWNADRTQLPLYCFLRSRREPLFRIIRIESAPFLLCAQIEHGYGTKSELQRERFFLERDRSGQLHVIRREPLR